MIVVTGGSGFFGISLVRALLATGERVRVLDREPIDSELANQVEYRQVDIRNQAETISALAGATVVYHNAAVVPISRAGQDFWAINERGTRHVLEGAAAAGAKRFIQYSTSSSLYGIPDTLPVTEESPTKPLGDYGKSKAAAEAVCREFRGRGMNLSIVRPRTIVGPGRLGIFQLLFEWMRTGKRVFVIGSGSNRLQLIGLDDLVAVSLLLRDRGQNEDFNIGARDFGTLRSDLEATIAAVGSASRVTGIPGWIARPGLFALDMLGLSPLVDLHYRTIDKDFYFDVGKAERLLGWIPQQSNVDALVSAYRYYAAHFSEIDSRYGSTHRRAVRKGLLGLLR